MLILHSTFNVQQSSASTLTVDKRTMSMDDRLSITVTLDPPFTDLEDIEIPLQNLTIESLPDSRVEFTWSGGEARHRKTLVYTARAKAPGAALVGPLVLQAGGRSETLAPLSVQVLPDITGGSNDPLTIARELGATHRDVMFLTIETDRTVAFVGQPVIVTWMLYNATTLQRYGVDDVPHLDDFWVEEIPMRDAVPEIVTLGELRLARVPIRRAALYPLRSGTLTIGSMTITAEAVRRVGMDRFGIPYEGMLIDITRRSPQLTIDARPVPPGPPVNAVGDVRLTCSFPKSAQGPVPLKVSMTGRANLRAAVAPAFERPVDGIVQVVDAGLTVDRRENDAVMTRRWRYVIFPARSGRMTIPPLAATILTPAGERQTLLCAAQTIEATAAVPPPATGPESPASPATVERTWPRLGAALALVALVALVIPSLRRMRARRATVISLVRPTAAETREAVTVWLASFSSGPGGSPMTADCRDARAALLSLLDAADHDRIPFDRREVRRRVADLVETCADSSRMGQSQNP